jgi:hypothetical protein
VSQEAEAVGAVEPEDGQPEVEGDAGEGGKVDARPCVGALVLPGEEGREEGDEEDEAVGQQEDDQHLAGGGDVVAPAAGAAAHQRVRQRHAKVHVRAQRGVTLSY